MATATKMYSITCTCGEKMQVDARGREEAVQKFKHSLDELTLANHAAEKHASDDAPTVEEMREIIEVTLAEE